MTAYPTISVPSPLSSAPTAFGRLVLALRARRIRLQTAKTYRDLLCVDDHVLLDLGVTRQEVHKLLQELEDGV